MSTLSRRSFLRAAVSAAALPSLAVLPVTSHAASFSFKCGHDLPSSHPVHARLEEAAARIKKESQGQFDLQIFGNNQLGGDTDMLGQVRSGALEMALMPDVILGTLSPVASISGVGFAFNSDQEACKAMDGELGAHVRAQLNKSGLVVMDTIWENGFRQITSSVRPIAVPEDLRGLKIRVPVAPLWLSMFKTLGASPAALNFSELYSALQTKVVEGQENPLSTINAGKLFEVQKYCSITNHFWNGYWMLASPRIWKNVPSDMQKLAAKHLNQSALDLRGDVANLNVSLEKTLAEKGMAFNRADPTLFRQALSKAGFYDEWSKKFGKEAWAILTRNAHGLA